jgi:RNA polymerase sigma-70 factor (ECF subfamily)
MEQNKLVNYIISTSKNTAYNSLRGKDRGILWEEQEALADPAPTPEDQIIAQEDLYRLAHVWGDLDERTQYLLSAKYILKKSGKEIAGDLNVPPDNVRMALVRAKRTAREAMGQRVSFP